MTLRRVEPMPLAPPHDRHEAAHVSDQVRPVRERTRDVGQRTQRQDLERTRLQCPLQTEHGFGIVRRCRCRSARVDRQARLHEMAVPELPEQFLGRACHRFEIGISEHGRDALQAGRLGARQQQDGEAVIGVGALAVPACRISVDPDPPVHAWCRHEVEYNGGRGRFAGAPAAYRQSQGQHGQSCQHEHCEQHYCRASVHGQRCAHCVPESGI